MSGKPILIGPFTGGLNNISLAGEAGDTQVVGLVNYEVALDQSLTSRPPMEVVAGSLLASGSTAGWQVLGVYRVTTSEWYVIAQKWTGTDWSLGYMLSGDPTNFVQIRTMGGVGNKVTGYAQVLNVAYFSVGLASSVNGFKWDKASGVVTDWTITGTGTNVIKGSILISYKSRLWLSGQDSSSTGSRVFFSTIDASGALKLDTWNKDVDFLDIAPGEGGFITAMLALNNSILMFKNDGTWRFSYPGSPSKGDVAKISGYVGAANQYSVVDFENYVYVYHQGRLYELINNIYMQINRTCRFDADGLAVDSIAPDVSLSIVTRRLVFRYYNSVYVYFIDTRAWSQWRSYCGTPGKFFQLPSDVSSANQSVFIAASQGTTQAASPSYIKDASFATTIGYIQGLITAGYSATLAAGVLTATKNTSSVDTLEVPLNESGGLTNYNIPVTSGQKFVATGTVSISAGNPFIRMTYLLRNGNTSVVDTAIAGAFNVTITAPDQALMARASLIANTMVNTGTVTLTNPSITRGTAAPPMTLIKISDNYTSSSSAVELIECLVRTKSYDYQAPSAWKGMFWWGIDVKTTRAISVRAIPVAKSLPITWGQLSAYTHTQLAAGTWGNPLSFLNMSITILDSADVSNSQTENGRIFVKLLKRLKFRQISFEVSMTTLGNSGTGPCKLFTMTSYVLPKENASAKVS
jgi:hypothetical protein